MKIRGSMALGLILGGVCMAVLILILLLAPPDASEEKPYQMLIGVSQANLIEPWRIKMNEEIMSEAEANDDIRLIITDAAMDPERQKEDIAMLMGYGIDLLIVSPGDTGFLDAVISEVHQKVPVIVLDQNMPGAKHTLHIGPNNQEIGRIAGEYTVNLLGEKGGQVVEIKGSETATSTLDRSIGFRDVLQGYPNVVICKELTANWMQDQAEDRMKEYLPLLDHPIDAIFAYNDSMGYGAAIALESFRFSHIPIIGVDGLPSENGGVALVEQGILECTIICPTGGKQAVESALRILAGEKDLPKQIILEPSLITKDDLLKEPDQNLKYE